MIDENEIRLNLEEIRMKNVIVTIGNDQGLGQNLVLSIIEDTSMRSVREIDQILHIDHQITQVIIELNWKNQKN